MSYLPSIYDPTNPAFKSQTWMALDKIDTDLATGAVIPARPETDAAERLIAKQINGIHGALADLSDIVQGLKDASSLSVAGVLGVTGAIVGASTLDIVGNTTLNGTLGMGGAINSIGITPDAPCLLALGESGLVEANCFVSDSLGGESDYRATVGSASAGDTVSWNLGVIEGSRNSRCKFFMTDSPANSGAWGLWQTYSSGGEQPFVIGVASTEILRITPTGAATFYANIQATNIAMSGTLNSSSTGNSQFVGQVNFLPTGSTGIYCTGRVICYENANAFEARKDDGVNQSSYRMTDNGGGNNWILSQRSTQDLWGMRYSSTHVYQGTWLEVVQSSGALTLGTADTAMTMRGIPTLPTYTIATLPTASSYTRGLIYISDETGGAVPAFSDGTNWRRVTDRAVAA